jgi:hypothetical protein
MPLIRSFPRPDDLKPEEEESVTRFIVHSNQFSKIGEVNYRAFEPPKSDLKTSVFRIINLTEVLIWFLGFFNVISPKRMRLYARADISYENIIANRLLLSMDEPPHRHAIIYNWPEQKSERMEIAMVLAAIATFKKCPFN